MVGHVRSVKLTIQMSGETPEPAADARPAPAQRRYGGQTTDERRAERRERLLDAGLELFGTLGFAATTIEAICAQARLNPRYFYEQFHSREELLGAVYDRHVRAVLDTVTAALASAPVEPRARLEHGLRAFIDGTLADERAARINYFEVVGVNRELEARRRQVLRVYAEMIAAQAAEMEVPAFAAGGDPRLAATALVSATDGLIIDLLSDTGGSTRDAAAGRIRIVTTLLHIFAPGT
jgi:AcrR family transcriptional regulator